MSEVTGIILAAGQSTRFGRDKLIARLSDNSTILSASARPMLEVIPKIIAVLAPGQTERQQYLDDLGIEILICSKALMGIGHSLACAVNGSSGSDAWVITLADLPYIQTQTIMQIYQQLQSGSQLVAPYYQGRRGHPVGISCQYKAELLNLTGDTGARSIFHRHSDKLDKLDTKDAGILRDIDLLSDL